MPERFEIYIVYKRRYINTLPFLSFILYGGFNLGDVFFSKFSARHSSETIRQIKDVLEV